MVPDVTLNPRQHAIRSLNEEVERKTLAAVEKAKESGKELSEIYRRALIPMSPGGVWAGKPIYVSRNDYYSIALFCISTFMVLKYALVVDILHTIICILVSYFWYDLYSGILHVVLDEPKNISLPFIGQPCLEFQWHHFIPSDIAREHFLDVAGDLNIAVSIMATLHIVWSSSWISRPYCTMFAGLKLLMAWFGQYSHRSAHSPRPKTLSPITKFLQRAGLMISNKAHKAHHKPPHDEDFCLLGVMEPVIEFMRHYIKNRYVWLGIFLFVSAYDVRILGNATKAILS